MDKKDYFSIGKVSDICGISIKTLRYYDKIKLLIPNHRKDSSKYRYYSYEQLVTLFIIKQLRYLGFDFKQIKDIIDNSDLDKICKIIDLKLKQLNFEKDNINRCINEIEVFKARMNRGNSLWLEKTSYNKSFPIQIEEIPLINIFAQSRLMRGYRNENVNIENWMQVVESAKEQKLNVVGSIFVSYYTDIFGQFLQKDCEIEFAIQVSDDIKKGIKKFGGFTAATLVHVGEYKDIIHKYIELKRWIEDNNYIISGNATEEFIISPIDTNNSDFHTTKILIPVKKNS